MTPGSRRSGITAVPLLTSRQNAELDLWFDQLEASSHWHGQLPVMLLERCWLRLIAVRVEELAWHLPPDSSWDAPELVRYRELVEQGHSPLTAEQLCWLEFGTDACRQAQLRLWGAQERGNQGWTLESYLQLLRDYRCRFETGESRQLPLMVLARRDEGGGGAVHELVWLGRGKGEAMRQTCA
ncbi:MAG: hypothetical protein NTW51_00605 [Cyanobacteria bacterium]|nr:hypothetical protein [Cyanobacteriota bacterium]